jgi:hypothetical protein
LGQCWAFELLLDTSSGMVHWSHLDALGRGAMSSFLRGCDTSGSALVVGSAHSSILEGLLRAPLPKASKNQLKVCHSPHRFEFVPQVDSPFKKLQCQDVELHVGMPRLVLIDRLLEPAGEHSLPPQLSQVLGCWSRSNLPVAHHFNHYSIRHWRLQLCGVMSHPV